LDPLPILIIQKKRKQAFEGYKVRNMKFFQTENFITDLKEQLLFKLNFDNHTSIDSQIALVCQTVHEVLEVCAKNDKDVDTLKVIRRCIKILYRIFCI